MKILLQPDFTAWRDAARKALADGLAPDQVNLVDATVPAALDLLPPADQAPRGPEHRTPHVPRAFLADAELAAAHRDPQRWNLLYRLLWRLQTERELLQLGTDEDVTALRTLVQQVRRDIHKMHAFVRFRKVEDANTDNAQPEHFAAWYEPDHRIVRLAAPHFAERFAVMQWTILTPDESATWDPQSKSLRFGPGTGRDAAPQADELESLWRSYYASIFNPARLNQQTMRSEMPQRFWKNLPELNVVPQLIQQSGTRVDTMMKQQQSKPSAAAFVPPTHDLQHIASALPACEGCDLFRFATQAVPGMGGQHARLMLVGEQPGDQEDRQGEPFVGPAGRVLQQALDEIGIDRNDVYVTNAVKHFKFVLRGKFRLHQNPAMSEINACRPWLLAELDAVKPKVVLCLGASAAKSLLGGTFALMRERGQMRETPYSQQVMATIHPSAVLRAIDAAMHDQLYSYLTTDLAAAHRAAMGT